MTCMFKVTPYYLLMYFRNNFRNKCIKIYELILLIFETLPIHDKHKKKQE